MSSRLNSFSTPELVHLTILDELSECSNGRPRKTLEQRYANDKHTLYYINEIITFLERHIETELNQMVYEHLDPELHNHYDRPQTKT